MAIGALINEMNDHPFQDRLGSYYQEIASQTTRDFRGEFYTPDSLCEMTAKMVIDVEAVIAKGEPITILEPCSGAGGMILALAKQFAPKGESEPSHVDLLRVTAVDVSSVAADMT